MSLIFVFFYVNEIRQIIKKETEPINNHLNKLATHLNKVDNRLKNIEESAEVTLRLIRHDYQRIHLLEKRLERVEQRLR